MAKKKQIVINNEELTPTVLATLKDRKKTSVFGIIWLAIIFAIFGVGIYYLPEISAYVNNYLNPEPVVTNSNNKVPNNEEEAEKPNEIIQYKISDNPEIVLDNLTIKNIKLENNILTFDLINNDKEIIDLKDKDYFIQLYSNAETLEQRIILNKGTIISGGSLTETFQIANEKVTHISFLSIKESEYPSYNLISDEYKNSTLVCKKDNETINYFLKNNKLYLLQDVYFVSATDSNYNDLNNTYQVLSASYNNIGGVTSLVGKDDTGLTFTTSIDLNKYTPDSLNIIGVFAKDTDAKVIKFELEASGYTCI